MSLNKIISITWLLLVPLTNTLTVFSQDNGENTVRVMFYNVENLFDTLDDSLVDDS